MAIDKAVPVPKKEITSVDVVKFDAGLYLNGAQDAPQNAFIDSKDVELTVDGYLTNRRVLLPFLPDTVEDGYQILPVTWNNQMYYFTADANKMRFCQEGDTTWTDCASPGVAATLTTALAGSDNDLKFTSTVLGTTGNSTAIVYVNPGTPSAALSVTVATTVITVHLATNGSSVITSTASQILTAIQASTAASALVTVALAPANTGSGVVIALSSTPLAGGSGTNIIHTNNGGKPKLLRVLDNVLLLNGTNGDKLCYADLSTAGFPVVKYALVADPSSTITKALTSIAAGSFNIYYAYSYTSAVGETKLSSILTISINTVRDQWQSMGTPGKITLTYNDTPPAGAQYRNLYMALAATSGTIQDSDMLQIATKIDITTTTFVDDGSLNINLGSVAPAANSTDGPYVDHGIVEDGNPILFGDPFNRENIYIGGGGPYAMDLSISNGGYTAQPEQGTNFQVTAIIGFRNGQGIPSLTVLFSNTEGLAKQSVLERQTVNYGNQSFSVWGVTEQHYGAAGVAATNSAINYNGKLLFLSTDGLMSMNTQPLRQNVISSDNISFKAIDPYIRKINTSAMNEVVGAGWNNKFMWTMPNDGFDTAQQILIADDNNNGAFYPLDIPAQWIGVVTPMGDPAFTYIVQDNKSYKLVPGSSTFDTKGGVPVPFSTSATGPMVPMGGPAHNHWQADVQAIFYVVGLVGDIVAGVNYRNQNGHLKTKTKLYHGPAYTPSTAGGWGDPGWDYASFASPSWGGFPFMDNASAAVTAEDVRIPVQIDDITNEAQWFFYTDTGYSAFKIRAISFEGINLGVRPDLQ